MTLPVPSKMSFLFPLVAFVMIRCQPALSWLWRISRRMVTHNHQRKDFDLLLADVQSHFQALTQNPADVLHHIGSPFAPDKDKDVTQPQTLAA